MKRLARLLLLLSFWIPAAAAQVAAPPAPGSTPGAASPQSPATPASPSSPTAPTGSNAEFLRTADEVLLQMSQLLHLPIREPLKKSLRSKPEIRAYLIREEKEDLTDDERYADRRTLEAFALIPKGFPLDSFMLDVLTDQVAGLYDPKAKEFYIADWIAVEDQRQVMSHEMTHALEDQSFQIDPWTKAARPNIDAELARQAVSEGSALAAMVDYMLRDHNFSVRDLPDVSELIGASAIDQMDKDPNLAKAPLYIRDSLLFPYLSGTTFTQQFLKAHTGWADLHLLFENPPISTQQILHPQLYLGGTQPLKVTLPEWKGLVPADWKFLEENVMGEFALKEILKQLLGQERADRLAPAWAGDRYAVFEDANTKETRSVFFLALDNVEDAARFFGQYSEALELKHETRTQLFRRPNYFQFQTGDGGVYLRCIGKQCLVVEGASRETYDAINRAVGWPAAPTATPDKPPASVAQLRSAASFVQLAAPAPTAQLRAASTAQSGAPASIVQLRSAASASAR